MCGIAGIRMKNGKQPPRKWLDGMLAALAHRGPDGRGEWAGDTTVLLHTRLAIIDPEGGAQPLFGNNAVLVGNGEIYNYRELNRQRDSQDDHSDSDFECTLRTDPRDFFRFRGMYALALVESDGALVLARDRYGIKPLYVADTEDYFAFASVPSALRVLDGVDSSLLPAAVTELLQQGWVTGRRTVYRGIGRLMPGEVITAGGVSRIATLPNAAQRSNISFDKAVKIFDQKFSESIELHQRSDVPYGLFLSGGIDSSAVLTMMARQNTAPVVAFTCGFDGTAAADERPRARDFAKALGADHHEVGFAESDFWGILPRVAAALDDPIVDYATLPTFKLAEVAARHLKVVISGEGGDEALGGYGRYRKAMRPWFMGGGQRFKGRFTGLNILRDDLTSIAFARDSQWSKLQNAQVHDFAGWLPDNLLIKLDRCLMAHGLEGRTPFLEPELTDFSFNLPDDFKVKNNLGKHLLRTWLAAHGPPGFDYFARKQGFTVPVSEWIAARGAQLAPLMACNEAVRAIAHPDRVAALYLHGGKRETTAAWALLFYAVWHAVHFEHKDPKSDVWHLLSE